MQADVWFMALAAALGTASIYPHQPAIADVAGSVQSSLATIGVALVIGVVGAESSAGGQLSSVAGRFANPQRRATVLDIVTAGISARIIAGGGSDGPQPPLSPQVPLRSR